MPDKRKEWGKVFKVALEEKEKLLKQNPKLSQQDATKKAWKTKRVQDAKAEYHKKFSDSSTKKKAPTKRKPAAKKTATKRKTTTKKPTTRKTTKRK